MATVIEATSPATPGDDQDPFRYGWRYVQVVPPQGPARSERVPLTLEDVLHPQEGDVILETPAHDNDCETIRLAAKERTAGRPGVVVLHDCRIDWGVRGVASHSPDISVFEGVAQWNPALGTFDVAEYHARILMTLEVTSPNTRDNDLDAKVVEYHAAGVPFYAIVDGRVSAAGERTIHLLGYRARSEGFERVRLDARGRLWLPPLGIWLAVEGGQVACYDEQGKRLGDHLLAIRVAEEARQLAETEKMRADVEKTRADAEKARADAEASALQVEVAARVALEARVKEIEAKLRHARGEQ
jgi:colicin import membrane protein